MNAMLRTAVVVALVGCNQFYGLDPTQLVDATTSAIDTDRDGVADITDNCIDVANEAQTDTDADGIGDACDPCSFAFNPALDRDADGLAALADNCPAIPNAPQTDSDLDGVGDACDPNPNTSDAVRCHADLATEVARSWRLNGPWKALGTDASAVIVHSPSDTPPFWLGANGSGLAPSQIAIQIATAPPSTTPTVATTGIAVAAADQTAFVACELVRDGVALSLRISDSAGIVERPLATSAPRMYLTLEYRRTSTGTVVRCTSLLEDATRAETTRMSDATFDASVIYLTSTNAVALFRAVTVYDTKD
jgi:hypothetical protein